MASFRKRGKYWRAEVRRTGFPPQSASFDTKGEAESWANVVESEMVRGVWVDRSELEGTTLLQLIDRYEKEVTPSKRGAAEESYKLDAMRLAPFVKQSIASIRSTHFSALRDSWLTSRKPSTVRRLLAIYSDIYETARKDWGLPAENPLRSIRMPAQGKSRERRLLPGEYKRLQRAARDYGGDISDIIRIAIETGMRRGELAACRWEDIDFRARTIHLAQTKNGEARTVPLSKSATRILLRLRPKEKAKGPVFSFTRADTITQAFGRVCDKAGIEGLTLHDLRHEAVSRLFEAGLDPLTVSAISGHKTMQMLRRYTHLAARDLVGVVERAKVTRRSRLA